MASINHTLLEIIRTNAFKPDNISEEQRVKYCQWIKGRNLMRKLDLPEVVDICMSFGFSMDRLLSDLNVSTETTKDTIQFLSTPSFPQTSLSADEDILGSLSNSPNDVSYRPKTEQITPPLPSADVAIVATSSPSSFLSLSNLSPHDKTVNVTRHRFLSSEQQSKATLTSTLPTPSFPITTTRFPPSASRQQRQLDQTGTLTFLCNRGKKG